MTVNFLYLEGSDNFFPGSGWVVRGLAQICRISLRVTGHLYREVDGNDGIYREAAGHYPRSRGVSLGPPWIRGESRPARKVRASIFAPKLHMIFYLLPTNPTAEHAFASTGGEVSRACCKMYWYKRVRPNNLNFFCCPMKKPDNVGPMDCPPRKLASSCWSQKWRSL